LLEAKATNKQVILTFGGAYSNHLYATAAAGNALGIRTIGVVRGLDFAERETPTLQFCREQGMQLRFVSREIYRLRHSEEYLADIASEFGDPFMIPEGGTTALALRGISEMVNEVSGQLGQMPHYFATAAGTGGTAAGILSAKADVLAFSALKGGEFLNDDIKNLLADETQPGKLTLFTEYHFGGYAKWNEELLRFMESFKNQFEIQLEQVYTAKMFYGLFDLIRKSYFAKGSVVVAVHTGGLQGLLRN
jgi:1-aminocyclopropane-1-carboxylate deaminase/D-cysteine desulfhydrase-like pyridoxal-dependent ACC family enzyme